MPRFFYKLFKIKSHRERSKNENEEIELIIKTKQKYALPYLQIKLNDDSTHIYSGKQDGAYNIKIGELKRIAISLKSNQWCGRTIIFKTRNNKAREYLVKLRFIKNYGLWKDQKFIIKENGIYHLKGNLYLKKEEN